MPELFSLVISPGILCILRRPQQAAGQYRTATGSIPTNEFVKKKAPPLKGEAFFLVNLVVGRWNTLLPSLTRMANYLEELGIRYSDGDELYINKEYGTDNDTCGRKDDKKARNRSDRLFGMKAYRLP